MSHAYLTGIGVAGPGLPVWSVSRPILAGGEPYCSAPLPRAGASILPPVERRRATAVTRLALDVATEALGQSEATGIASVFASSGGEVEVIHGIFEQLAGSDRRLSPTAFHNSVHNAAAGYWSIATGSQRAGDALCAYDDSFGSGLAAAYLRCLEGESVLLIAYDLPPPFPIAEFRPITDPFAVALLLSPRPAPGVVARIAVAYSPEPPQETALPDAALERLRLGNPAARSLPLLSVLARGRPETLQFGCGMGGSLRVELRAWS